MLPSWPLLSQLLSSRDYQDLLKLMNERAPIGVELAADDAPRLPRGRRPLTDDQVRADLDRALARLATDRGITRPTWEQLAGAHDGLGWEGMTPDGLRKRRKAHPIPFGEKVPHLTG